MEETFLNIKNDIITYNYRYISSVSYWIICSNYFFSAKYWNHVIYQKSIIYISLHKEFHKICRLLKNSKIQKLCHKHKIRVALRKWCRQNWYYFYKNLKSLDFYSLDRKNTGLINWFQKMPKKFKIHCRHPMIPPPNYSWESNLKICNNLAIWLSLSV